MTVFYWHAGLMALAWLVLLPGGAVIARFYKVRPGRGFPDRLDDPFWWNGHRVLQWAGAAVTAAGFWLAFDARDRQIDWMLSHVQFGMAALALCAAQIGSTFLRGSKGGPTGRSADPTDPLTWRGDHYDMTLRRRLFEGWHKPMGYVAVALAGCAVWTGTSLAPVPAWVLAVMAGFVACYTAVFVTLTRRRRWVDTWVAIWGPNGR